MMGLVVYLFLFLLCGYDEFICLHFYVESMMSLFVYLYVYFMMSL